jgi:hypothetical protein
MRVRIRIRKFNRVAGLDGCDPRGKAIVERFQSYGVAMFNIIRGFPFFDIDYNIRQAPILIHEEHLITIKGSMWTSLGVDNDP